MSKIMQVFYGTDCLPYKDKAREVHYPIVGQTFQGSSQTTEIRFYPDKIGGIDCTWVAVSKLPNGKTGSELLQSAYDSENEEYYYSLKLSSFYTQAQGNLFISLQGYDGGIELEYDSETELYEVHGTPVIEATGSIKIAINYATQAVGSDEIGEGITIQEILASISTKLSKNSNVYLKIVPSWSSINTEEYKDFINAGDIIYEQIDGIFYRVSGEYPNFTVSEDCDIEIHFLNASRVYTRHLDIPTFGDIENDLGKTLEQYIAENYITISALENYYTKTESDNKYVNLTLPQTISGQKTFSSGIKVETISDLDDSSNISLSEDLVFIYSDSDMKLSCPSDMELWASDVWIKGGSLSPIDDNSANLGGTTIRWKDLYLSGNITDGTNSLSISQIASKTFVANLIDTVNQNSFILVDTTEYTSLQDFLDNFTDAEEGHIYLYPVDLSDPNEGYYEYIYESNDWILLGVTSMDLANYYTKSEVDTMLSGKQDLMTAITTSEWDAMIGD